MSASLNGRPGLNCISVSCEACHLAPRTELVSHRELARLCGVSARTVRAWIETGAWPLPECTCRSLLYFCRADAEHWILTGRWPEGSRFRTLPEAMASG